MIDNDSREAPKPTEALPEDAMNQMKDRGPVVLTVREYVKELSDAASAQTRAELSDTFWRWMQPRVQFIGFGLAISTVLCALFVLVFGNALMSGMVRNTLEIELKRLNDARIDALTAAKSAQDKAKEAGEQAKTLGEGFRKLRETTEQIEQQLAAIKQLLPSVVDASIEAAVASMTESDEMFAENSRVPVYLVSSTERNKTIVSEIIRNASKKGFRVTPYPPERGGIESPESPEIVYSCGRWMPEGKEREEILKRYEEAAHRLGLAFPVRQESGMECDLRLLPRGVTIVLP